jgi:hypothetical protein
LITPLGYMMVQAVTFGIGMIVILATPLTSNAWELVPWMIAITFILSVPIALMIAPHLKARQEIHVDAPAQ